MGDFGAGFFAALVLVAIFMFGNVAGFALTASQCNDYGKTSLGGAVYECKKVEKK